MTALLLGAAVAAGYLAGRARPARAISDWAAWQTRPRGLRYAAVWTIRSAEGLGWLAAHPVQGWRAWRTRDTPPTLAVVPVRADPWPPDRGPR
ncbi:hypothetical protein [Streptomyces lavendulae]|uniref:hypothetical protein n=1 Tax=Streptomyces lavendulae TaxID=1914 RepID=UPI0033F48707